MALAHYVMLLVTVCAVAGCTQDFGAFQVEDEPARSLSGQGGADVLDGSTTAAPDESMAAPEAPSPEMSAPVDDAAEASDAGNDLTSEPAPSFEPQPSDDEPGLATSEPDTGASSPLDSEDAGVMDARVMDAGVMDAAVQDAVAPICEPCSAPRDLCDVDCSRDEDECLLTCTGNPGQCRQQCEGEHELCRLECLRACDDCVRASGCATSCE